MMICQQTAFSDSATADFAAGELADNHDSGTKYQQRRRQRYSLSATRTELVRRASSSPDMPPPAIFKLQYATIAQQCRPSGDAEVGSATNVQEPHDGAGFQSGRLDDRTAA